ncbi:hypothetical protein E2C01_014120 [Portunus trituberculatus]|uniref:Secreted protein n=1 Tax=Portunus trituberculatus TaxID=210409 RepID=A0A5B7DJ16_PORTR|nr:hypothetical protein [Portunus trituberculatus]
MQRLAGPACLPAFLPSCLPACLVSMHQREAPPEYKSLLHHLVCQSAQRFVAKTCSMGGNGGPGRAVLLL